eukprot:13518720-Heterocapsa_arctica.AAC.1
MFPLPVETLRYCAQSTKAKVFANVDEFSSDHLTEHLVGSTGGEVPSWMSGAPALQRCIILLRAFACLVACGEWKDIVVPSPFLL